MYRIRRKWFPQFDCFLWVTYWQNELDRWVPIRVASNWTTAIREATGENPIRH